MHIHGIYMSAQRDREENGEMEASEHNHIIFVVIWYAGSARLLRKLSRECVRLTWQW